VQRADGKPEFRAGLNAKIGQTGELLAQRGARPGVTRPDPGGVRPPLFMSTFEDENFPVFP